MNLPVLLIIYYRTFFDPISTISQHLVAPQHHYEIRNKFLNHIRGILEIPAWTGIVYGVRLIVIRMKFF